MKTEDAVNPFNVQMSQLKDILTAPLTYEEAFYHQNSWCRQRWRAAIKLELDKMNQYQVWHTIPKNLLPKGRKAIKNKWIFDIKRTGIFRARLVACGYSQVPGIDFSDFYAPVVNDSVFRIILILQIVFQLSSAIMDVETAFLNGGLKEKIYMLPPKGSNIPSWLLCELDKALYGLVQAARQFYLKFAEILKSLNFTISYADPCLFYREDIYGKLFLIIHVDDCYVVGHPKAIDHLAKELNDKGLKTKVSKESTDYLSCEIKFNPSKTMAWVGQPTLMNKLIKKFGDKVEAMGNYNYKTPGTPGFSLVKPDSDIGILSPKEQTDYRSGVGTLLQFANKTRPDIVNAVRELSRGMDKATKSAEKEMYRIIKYLIQTKDYGLKIAPKGNFNDGAWTMKMYTDSDWATNKTDRKSISGFVLYFQDTPILWKSQTQKTVALSSTEAEYYATSEATKEIKFIIQVLESLGIEVQKPIIVHLDNVGAIFVAETPSATKQTRHIDARYHFVREYIVDGTIRIIFVSSKNNKADLFTKNVTSEVYEEHVGDFIIHREVLELSSDELNTFQYFDSGGVSGSTTTSTTRTKDTTTPSSVDTVYEPKYENDVSTNNEMLNICNPNIQYNNKVINKYSPEYYYKYKKNKNNNYKDDNNPSDTVIDHLKNNYIGKEKKSSVWL